MRAFYPAVFACCDNKSNDLTDYAGGYDGEIPRYILDRMNKS